MRHVYYFLMGLPSQCSHMPFDDLLLMAALLTLVIAAILMISGRQLA
jgi:hypothetical protein